MRTSAPIHPEECCCLKSKVLSLSGHPMHPSCTSVLSPPSSSMAEEHGPCLLTLEKGSRLLKPSARGKFSTFPSRSIRPMTGCGAWSTSLWVHRNLFWQLLRDRNLHGLGMSHAMTAFPKPSFRAPWRVNDAVVGRENAGWTTSKGGHPYPYQTCSRWPPVGKTGRGSQCSQVIKEIWWAWKGSTQAN